MGVIDRFLDARRAWEQARGQKATKVYVSPLTEARALAAAAPQDVPADLPAGFMGWACGCAWWVDPTMGDGFRFAVDDTGVRSGRERMVC